MAIINFAKRVFQEWSDDKVPRLAASLSYFTVFSLAPLLIIIVAVAGLLLGVEAVQKQIVAQMGGLVGTAGGDLVNSLLTNARPNSTNILATIFGIVAILLGATGVIGELKDSLNTIWNVAPKPGRSIFGTFFERIVSFGMLLAVAFLLLVSLAVSTVLASVGNYIRAALGDQTVILATILDLVVSIGVISILFALLFKFLPDVKVAWRDVWIGALVTAVLFTLGKFLIGVYIGNSNIATPFGAAGSLVVLLIWIYYSAQILFLGAEITQVYAVLYGSGIQPASDAVALSDAARVAQGTKAPPKPGAVRTPAPQAAAARGKEPELTDGARRAMARELSPQLPEPALPIEPFQPLQFLGAVLGVRVFGLARQALKRSGQTVRDASRTLSSRRDLPSRGGGMMSR